ncbi:hypothetical protein HU200_008895 [Digitaria exilis]|uniref:Uncharacterized protein n=1 Tax=Digitaria exilis TaxID=1010633 RepID=A0A835FKY7_9POAL|nr:hypothetical protein HU200_008895 [Digitaria exilis]
MMPPTGRATPPLPPTEMSMKAFARFNTMPATRTRPSKQPSPPRLRNVSNGRGPTPSAPPPEQRWTSNTIGKEKGITHPSPQHLSPARSMPPTPPSPSPGGIPTEPPQPATATASRDPRWPRSPAPPLIYANPVLVAAAAPPRTSTCSPSHDHWIRLGHAGSGRPNSGACHPREIRKASREEALAATFVGTPRGGEGSRKVEAATADVGFATRSHQGGGSGASCHAPFQIRRSDRRPSNIPLRMGRRRRPLLLSLALLLMITTCTHDTSSHAQAAAAAVTQQHEEHGGVETAELRREVLVAVQVPITPQENRGHATRGGLGGGGGGRRAGASSSSLKQQQQQLSLVSSYNDHSNYKPLSWRCKCAGLKP